MKEMPMAKKHNKKQCISMVIKETQAKAIRFFHQIVKYYIGFSSFLLTKPDPAEAQKHPMTTYALYFLPV